MGRFCLSHAIRGCWLAICPDIWPCLGVCGFLCSVVSCSFGWIRRDGKELKRRYKKVAT